MISLETPPDLTEGLDRCSGCPIRRRAVCSYSSADQLAVLDDAKFYKDYEPGQDIVSEGEETAALGSIVSGVVSLQHTLEDGRRQVVGLLFPSDFIGRPLRPTAPYDAVAVTPVKMCLFHRSQFESLMSDNISLERRLLEMTLDELDAARSWMVLLGRKTARERLASFLIILARRAATLAERLVAEGDVVTLPLGREAIAEYLGLTIETVSRQFTALRKEGLIELPDRKCFVVSDLDGLIIASGDDELTDPRNMSA
jgi:CRP/FNR family transcriptional regulator